MRELLVFPTVKLEITEPISFDIGFLGLAGIRASFRGAIARESLP